MEIRSKKLRLVVHLIGFLLFVDRVVQHKNLGYKEYSKSLAFIMNFRWEEVRELVANKRKLSIKCGENLVTSVFYFVSFLELNP